MAQSTEFVDKEVGALKVCNQDKLKATNEGVSCNTQVSQPKEPAKKGDKSGVESLSTTPKPGSSKRSRSPGTSTSLSQKAAPPKFARSCKKCGDIRSSLKLEIASLKKTHASEVKTLRENVISLKKDKGDLRNSVNFLQRMYSNLLRENTDLKSKNAELKKIIMC